MEFFHKCKASSVLEKLLNATNNRKWPKRKELFSFVVVAVEISLMIQP